MFVSNRLFTGCRYEQFRKSENKKMLKPRFSMTIVSNESTEQLMRVNAALAPWTAR